jgi:hypothetical protein
MTHCLVNHHITGLIVFFLVSPEWVVICPVIDNPTSWEICTYIPFLHTKNMTTAEIRCKLYVIYSQNGMSDGTVRQRCRMFKDGQTNVQMKSKVCSEWWLCSRCWPKKFVKDGTSYFTPFVWISANFTHCSLWDYYSQAMLSQPLCKMGPENAHRCAQKAENGFGFDFFRVTVQRWQWTSQSHHDRWWILGFICECWNQGTVKVVDAHPFIKQAEKV